MINIHNSMDLKKFQIKTFVSHAVYLPYQERKNGTQQRNDYVWNITRPSTYESAISKFQGNDSIHDVNSLLIV